MSQAMHAVLTNDPVSGGPLYISELTSDESGVKIRGRFEMPRFSRLSPEQAQFLEVFLRNRGMLNGVERELGISYPTARGRLDGVLAALGLRAVEPEEPSPPAASPKEVIEQLERGEISAEQARMRLEENR